MGSAPVGSTWLQLWTPRPVDRRQGKTPVLLKPEGGALFARELRTRRFSQLDGLLFYVSGYAWEPGAPEPDVGDDAQPWELPAVETPAGLAPAFVLHVTFMSVWWPGSPLRAECNWYPGAMVATDTRPVAAGATPDDHQRAAKAMAALVAFSEGVPRRGKSEGDGATWAGGIDHFLDDLWTTLDALTKASGTRFGHDPTSRQFLSAMREHPSARTMRDWLKAARLRPRDIESGDVTRSNYSQFVAK